jgi:hypothetical protein
MGPWTFEVEGAAAQTDMRGQDRYRQIRVSVRLHNYSERHEEPFDDFLNGTTSGSAFADPHLALVDGQGNRFDGWVTPRSGGSRRSERWQAKFELIPLSFRDVMSSQSASEQAAEFLDKQAADFRLVIDNPDPSSGQPHRVAIQLE